MFNTLITDLDGTLLGDDHDISKSAIEFLNKLNEDGIKVILATGRNYSDALRVRNKLNFIPAIVTSNGAEVTNEKDELIYKEHVSRDLVESILSIDYKQIAEDIYINFVEQNEWVILENYPENHKVLEWEKEDWPCIKKDIEELDYDDILKIYYTGKPKDLNILLEKVIEKVGDKVNYAFTLPFCLEFFPKDIDKASGLKRLNIDFDKAISFGDGFNDVEMLKLTKKSYIMGNAPENLKNLLPNSEVILANYEDGLLIKAKEIFGVE